MTQTVEQQIAILHPVAYCISFESIARAFNGRALSQADILESAASPIGLKATDRSSARLNVIRVQALARIVLATPVSDTEGYFDTAEEIDRLREAFKVAREVLAK